MDQQAIIDHTRRWIAAFVIGLDLCPFAGRVFAGDKIRFVVSGADDEAALANDLARECQSLAAAPIEDVETTLLIHPRVLTDFLAYNDFLDVADQTIDALGLHGVVQVASFHPDYQFADTDQAAVENYTNRSPYPMLHLLREASVSAVAGDPQELEQIPRRNIATLRELGIEKVLEKLKALASPHRPQN